MRYLMITILLILHITALGSTADASHAPCRSTDLFNQSIGFKCITSSGAIWERVAWKSFKRAWRSPNGLIWSEIIVNSPQTYAEKICQNLGATLPSVEDFYRDYNNDFCQIFRNLEPWTTNWFWTSTIDPRFLDLYGRPELARTIDCVSNYNQGRGTSGWENRFAYEGQARCVGR